MGHHVGRSIHDDAASPVPDGGYVFSLTQTGDLSYYTSSLTQNGGHNYGIRSLHFRRFRMASRRYYPVPRSCKGSDGEYARRKPWACRQVFRYHQSCRIYFTFAGAATTTNTTNEFFGILGAAYIRHPSPNNGQVKPQVITQYLLSNGTQSAITFFCFITK